MMKFYNNDNGQLLDQHNNILTYEEIFALMDKLEAEHNCRVLVKLL